jgi:AcrR family transcriptional regulator
MADEARLREGLIKKAIEIFSHKGYEATNLSDITDALGISRGPVYYHFRDKRGLYEAAFNVWASAFQHNHELILAQDKHIIKILEDSIYCCIELYREFRPNFFVGIDTAQELSELRDRYHWLLKHIHDRKVETVRRAIEKGEIRKSISPELVVDMIQVLFDGIRDGLERPLIKIKDSELKTIMTVYLLGIERFCCD